MPVEVEVGSQYEGPYKPVNINAETPVKLDTSIGEVQVLVRIKQPDVTSDYFGSETRQKDRFSIQFVIEFSKDVSGDKLLWGNDSDTPVRDILPWGFSAAFKAFKYTIDPSVDGDMYADKPYLYGPALSSINYVVRQPDSLWKSPLLEEHNADRRKKFLDKAARDQFTFHKGEVWAFDFVTPYLEMSKSFAIELPFFTFDVGKYAKQTYLRYVLKDGDKLAFAIKIEVPSEDFVDSDSTSSSASTIFAFPDASKGPLILSGAHISRSPPDGSTLDI